MNFATRAMLAAACAAFLFAPAASAARLSDCIQLSKQTEQALAAAKTDDAATQAARVKARDARNLCSISMYAQGVASYTKALQLLGKS